MPHPTECWLPHHEEAHIAGDQTGPSSAGESITRGRRTMSEPSKAATMANVKPVDLKTKCNVIRMDSLKTATHTLRQIGGDARLGSKAEELCGVCPSLGGSPSDVLSARQIFIGLPIIASNHERDAVALARLQELSRCLRHHEARAQHERRLPGRKGADRPCRGLLHNSPSANVNRPQQARRVDRVESGRGRTVFEHQSIRMARLEREGFVQRLSKNDLFCPLAKGPGSHGESTHDVDHDGHGRGFGQLGDTKETGVHSDHDRACPTQSTRGVIRITSTVSECNTRGCLRREGGPHRHTCSIATRGHPHTASADTRHSCATHNYESGMPLWDVQKILGHEWPTTTVGYLGSVKADPEKASLAASHRAVRRLSGEA